ncbi:MAG: DUF5615 family PIN-like protein [Siphonobacter aquaeclarae]|nr:DUF5615 family PIN-like protein [Siphonobacter aquaeclarae]
MILVVDEGVEARIVASLREEGFDVLYVAEFHRSISDRDVLGIAVERQGIILTKDKDFGELVFRDHFFHAGIVLIRLDEGMGTSERTEIVCHAFRQFGDQFERAFSVITKELVRIRSFFG